MDKKAILFDMDGTLVDTIDDLTSALNFTMGYFGYPLKTKAEVIGYVGNGLTTLVNLGLPEGQKDKTELALKIFKAYYKDHLVDKTAPYAGIVALVNTLKQKNYRLAVVSNKVQNALDELIHKFFGDNFDFVIGQRADIKQKPAPDSVYLALNALKISKDEAIYIGDSDVDLMTAKNAGIDCVSCSWGFKTRVQLLSYGAKTIIDKPCELLDLLK